MQHLVYQSGIHLAVLLMLCLLGLKLTEMLKCIHWVILVAEDFGIQLHSSLGSDIHGPGEILKQYDFPFFPGNTALTRWTRGISDSFLAKRLPGRAFSLIVFRYPNLVVLCSLLMLLPINTYARCLTTALLLFAVWAKAFQLMIYRYKFGVLDNLLQSLSVPRMSVNVDLVALELRGVRNFVRIFPATLISAIVAYAAAYYNFSKNAVPGNTLQGVIWAQPLAIQTLYFSTSTFCTVGYGDLVAEGWVIQLTAVTEMILSVTLLILFVTAFSSTAALSKRSD